MNLGLLVVQVRFLAICGINCFLNPKPLLLLTVKWSNYRGRGPISRHSWSWKLVLDETIFALWWSRWCLTLVHLLDDVESLRLSIVLITCWVSTWWVLCCDRRWRSWYLYILDRFFRVIFLLPIVDLLLILCQTMRIRSEGFKSSTTLVLNALSLLLSNVSCKHLEGVRVLVRSQTEPLVIKLKVLLDLVRSIHCNA